MVERIEDEEGIVAERPDDVEVDDEREDEAEEQADDSDTRSADADRISMALGFM